MHPRARFIFSILVWIALTSVASAQMVTTPNVMGMSESEAKATLAEAGFSGKIHVEVDTGSKCASSDMQEGSVCSQTPGVAKSQAAFLDVWLVLQGRRSREQGAQVEAVPKVKVPREIYGLTEEEAVEKLVVAGFTGAIEVIPAPNECQHPEGSVCGSKPATSVFTSADTDVIIYIQPKRTLDSPYGSPPDVAGKPVADAISSLFEQNFRKISIVIQDDVRCQAGIVCDAPGSAEIVSRTTTVSLKVGTEYPGRDKTPSYRQLDMMGDDLATVIKKIDAMGTDAKLTIEPNGRCPAQSQSLPPRTVCSLSPPPGQETSGRFTTATLTADAIVEESAASTSVMPDVIGMPIMQATATLEAAGLARIRVKEMRDPDCQPGTICSTSPAAGKKAYAQVMQTLYVGSTEAPGGDALTDSGPAPDTAIDDDVSDYDWGSDDTDVSDDARGNDDIWDTDSDDEEISDYEPLFKD